MKSIIVSIIFSLNCMLSVALPRLKFVTNYVNIGRHDITQGLYSFKIGFINTGDTPLYLTNIVESCSCIKTEFSEMAVLPGDTSTFIVNYSFTHDGEFMHSLDVYYNSEDPELKSIVTFYGVGYLRKPEEE